MVLKKVFAPCFVFLLLSTPVFAGYAVDVYGAFLGIGKTVNQCGGGGALGISVIDNFSLLYRGMYTAASRETGSFTKYFYTDKKKYSHMMHMAGVEYVLVIPELRLGWRNSLMVGYSKTRLDVVDMETNFLESAVLPATVPGAVKLLNIFKVRHLMDQGFSIAYWTGFQVNVLPFLSPFIDIGLHKSFYNRDLDGKKIIGFHLMFGIRFSPGSG